MRRVRFRLQNLKPFIHGTHVSQNALLQLTHVIREPNKALYLILQANQRGQSVIAMPTLGRLALQVRLQCLKAFFYVLQVLGNACQALHVLM